MVPSLADDRAEGNNFQVVFPVLFPMPALLGRKDECSPLLQEGNNAIPKALTDGQVLPDQSSSTDLLYLMYYILGCFLRVELTM